MKHENISKTKKNGRNRIFLIVWILFFGTLIGIVFRDEFLALPGWILVRNELPFPSTRNILVLMGDSSARRAKTAFEIWKKYPQAKIIVIREKPEGFVALGLADGRDDIHLTYFLKAGVPESSLYDLKDCLTTSTYDEAQCLKANLFRFTADSPEFVVVTDWFHSSRAGWLFDHVLRESGVLVHVVPAAVHDPYKGPKNWWRDEEMFLRVFEEYIKWTYWRLKNLIV
jgi:uncharacterized SAM-binding protein YcdF (DUF218 family)